MLVAAVRKLNRLEILGETVRSALNSLAVAAPSWLNINLEPAWLERYTRRVENYRLPKLDAEREALGNLIGKDGFTLLTRIYAPLAPEWLGQIPAVEVLRQMWVQQFYAPDGDGKVQWRSVKDMPPATIGIHSPHDVQAHYSSKRSINWVGYKMHATEICDEDHPRFITHVHTTLSTTSDDEAVEPIHQALATKELLPQAHLMDCSYLAAEHLVNSKMKHGVDIIGPVREDHSWQAKANQGFAVSRFKLDWTNKTATCLQGHRSTKWSPGKDTGGQPVVRVRFLGSTCRSCPLRSQCTRSKAEPRELTLRLHAQQIALQTRRQEQHNPEFHQRYRQRAGIESTHSQGIRRSGLRRSRYIGLDKTHLQHILIATGLNLVRLDAWLNEIPLAATRVSRFTKLRPSA